MSFAAGMCQVSEELRLAHLLLSQELMMVRRETELGTPIDVAIEHFAKRTTLDAIGSLAAFVAQSYRFGTSMGEAMRELSEMLRIQREQRAEELAHKAAVKVLLPTVIFIFPAISWYWRGRPPSSCKPRSARMAVSKPGRRNNRPARRCLPVVKADEHHETPLAKRIAKGRAAGDRRRRVCARAAIHADVLHDRGRLRPLRLYAHRRDECGPSRCRVGRYQRDQPAIVELEDASSGRQCSPRWPTVNNFNSSQFTTTITVTADSYNLNCVTATAAYKFTPLMSWPGISGPLPVSATMCVRQFR